MTTNITAAADTVAAAHVQGLHAFMAAEAKAAATDTQLEAAAGLVGGPILTLAPEHAACRPGVRASAAHVQGLHAFMASEAKAAATDTQLEAAAAFFGRAYMSESQMVPTR